MLSYKMDFSSCRIVLGFGKSSHINIDQYSLIKQSIMMDDCSIREYQQCVHLHSKKLYMLQAHIVYESITFTSVFVP